jgi:hypothetical protein
LAARRRRYSQAWTPAPHDFWKRSNRLLKNSKELPPRTLTLDSQFSITWKPFTIQSGSTAPWVTSHLWNLKNNSLKLK